MFIAALSVIAKNRKQPKWPSMHERLNKLVDLHHRMLLSNKKVPTIHTYNNLDESQGNYTEWKMPISKIYTVWFHSWETLNIPTWGWKADRWLQNLEMGKAGVTVKWQDRGSSRGDRAALCTKHGGVGGWCHTQLVVCVLVLSPSVKRRLR